MLNLNEKLSNLASQATINTSEAAIDRMEKSAKMLAETLIKRGYSKDMQITVGVTLGVVNAEISGSISMFLEKE